LTRERAIRTRNGEELENVLVTLFSLGFVFNNQRRIKTFAEFCECYSEHSRNNWSGWSWISLGKDRECKMVMNAYTVQPFDSYPVKLEEMVEMVKTNNW